MSISPISQKDEESFLVMKVLFYPRDKGIFLVCEIKYAPTLLRLKWEGPVHAPL